MRRTLSSTLLLVLLLPSFAAVLLPTTEIDIPACCRTRGQHHCMMLAEQMLFRHGVTVGVLHENCPAFPKAAAKTNPQSNTGPLSRSGSIAPVSTTVSAVQAEAPGRQPWSRSRQKRGPPPQTA